ncbi:MAG: hypothetical protein ABII00_17130 [Elusimicrobiota bacterium]
MAAVLLLAGSASAERKDAAAEKPTLESLFLDWSKTELGPLSSREGRNKYLYTIQIEKSQLMSKLLRTVYENAYSLYRQGDFDGARELTSKILSMDPEFRDAAILYRAAVELKGSSQPLVSERKLVADRFEEGIALYRQGRLVEASQRWDECVKLSPGNLKARYWLKKVRHELADEHFRRGQKAYRQHRMRDALDQWYAALVLHPKYPRLVGVISEAEARLRRQEANEKLQRALSLYGEGRTEDSLKLLDEVLAIEPGEEKAQKLIAEIRLEIAKQHVAEGRKLYERRKYTSAIKQWSKAVEFGYDPRRANVLISRARNQMRKEAEARRRRAEAKAQSELEAREKAEREERERGEQEALEQAERARQLDATPPRRRPRPSPRARRTSPARWATGPRGCRATRWATTGKRGTSGSAASTSTHPTRTARRGSSVSTARSAAGSDVARAVWLGSMPRALEGRRHSCDGVPGNAAD